MAFQLIDGFDMYNGAGVGTGVQAFWSSVGSGGTIAMGTGRFSDQCLKLTDGGGVFPALRRMLAASQASFSVGFAFKYDSVSSLGTGLMVQLMDSAPASQLSFYVVGSTGVLKVTRGQNVADLIVSSPSLIASGVWNYIELFGTVNSTTGTLELWVNGTQIGTFSGNTQQTGNANIQGIQLQVPDISGSSSGYFDDLYITDTASRVGERRVETLRPNADTATKNFTPLTGTANYAMVDESQVDGDTSYVQASVVGNRDLYSIAALSSTPTTIDAVQVVSFAEKTDATTRAIYNSVQSAGTDSDGSSMNLSASYSRYNRIIANDPNGGGAWTASRVNGLLIGPKVAA